MIQPNELKAGLPMEVGNGVMSTTTMVWEILSASYHGNVQRVSALASDCPELVYAQYNYTPPIHFAVREGHVALVNYLLENGAYDRAYRTYPFLDTMLDVAHDRNYNEIVMLIENYCSNPGRQKFKGDNGRIHFARTDLQNAFEQSVNNNDLQKTRELLKIHPEFALDETFFWGEGILAMPAKENHREMVELLMHYGAKVPDILKWTQAYYFERYDGAAFMMEKGMNPNVMSWHHVTILHDMAQKGDEKKAELLIRYGADLNPVEEEYQSTPLGMAVRWGHTRMVKYLLEQGADPHKSGAPWAAPLAWAKRKGHTEMEEILRKAGAV